MYSLLHEYATRAASQLSEGSISEISKVVWEENGNYVVPWAEAEDLENARGGSSKTYPSNCGYYSDKR